MKGGLTPIHIQRFSPADFHSDEWVRVLEKRRAYLVLTFYRCFIDYSFMHGGDLPGDPMGLASVLGMPLPDVRVGLKWCLNRLVFKDGDRLYQPRVRREVQSELTFRRQQAELGKRGGRPKEEGKPKARVSDAESPPTPLPTPAPTPTPTPITAVSTGGERDVLVKEGHALIREIAPLANLDPTEVVSKASLWKGFSYVRLDVIPGDRLSHTLNNLRRWKRDLRGETEPSLPKQAERASPQAQARQDAMVAGIKGGLRDEERQLDPRMDAVKRLPPGPRPDRRDVGGEG